MKKFNSVFSLSLAAALALSLAACSDHVGTSVPTSSPSATVSPSSSPSVSPTATPTPTATTPAATGSTADTSNELAEAKKAFPNLQVKDEQNKDDVLLATYDAVRYVDTVFNSGYLANGSWAKNGASGEQLYKIFGNNWSDTFRAKMDGMVADYHSSDAATQVKAQKELLYYMFFTDSQMGSFQFPDDCSQNNVGANSCLVGNKPTIDKEVTYQINPSNGSIYVNVTFTGNLRVINGGVEGVSAVHYDLQLEMVKDQYPDAKNLRYAYVVNDIGGSWNIDSWHKGE